MRADFDKVLTERPRVGGGAAYRSGKRVKEDEVHEDFSRKREPMSMGRGSKEFTDLITPLYRWMEQQVGRPWNKVYSEIKANFASNNLQHTHLIDHVRWMVELNCFKKNYKIYNSQGLEINSHGGRRAQFYVMDDGILKMVKKPRQKFNYSSPKAWTELDGKKYKADKDGVWFEIELAPTSLNIYLKPNGVILFDGVYCSKKRQLNTKEKKKLKLS